MMPVVVEPIASLDPERPLQALSLPAWLQRCLNALTRDFSSPTIPTDLGLTEDQRAAIAVRVRQLGEAEIACDVDHTMAVVVQLSEGFPAGRLSDDQARLKAKAYITALEGVPTWAVAEASRRWLQARAGPQNYDFVPSPPRLREIADDVLADLRAQRIALRRLLSAKTQLNAPPDPAMEQRINRQFAQLLDRLKGKAV